ncbi:MAG: TadE family protein [Rubripirellula sp.]
MDSARKGTATVELAILTPFLMILTLGTMDICSMIFLKESATIAAYEGARRGIQKGSTNQDATQRVLNFLEEREIAHDKSKCIKISKPSFERAETLQHVTVTVILPIAGNLLIAPHIIDEMNLKASVTMRKEYRNESG